MRRFKLDKCYKQGTTYRMEADKGLVIEAIGTNSTAAGEVRVGGGVCFVTYPGLAVLRSNSSNVLGPMELGDLKIVVPPDKTFEVSGSSGALWRVIGYIVELDPGEAFPSDLMGRYEQQFKLFYDYHFGQATPGDNAAWNAGVEYDAINWVCPAGERWVFDSIITAEPEQNAWGDSYGKCAIRIYVDDRPFDLIETAMGMKGLDAQSIEHPPTDANNLKPVTLADMPIVIEPGHNLRISAQNISGSNWSAPGSGNYNRVSIRIVGKRQFV